MLSIAANTILPGIPEGEIQMGTGGQSPITLVFHINTAWIYGFVHLSNHGILCENLLTPIIYHKQVQ